MSDRDATTDRVERVERRGDDIPVPRPVCFFCHQSLDSKEHIEQCVRSRGDDDTNPGIVRHG